MSSQLSSTNSMNIVRRIHSTYAWRKFCSHTNAQSPLSYIAITREACRVISLRHFLEPINFTFVLWNRQEERSRTEKNRERQFGVFENSWFFILDCRASWSNACERSTIELHRWTRSLYYIWTQNSISHSSRRSAPSTLQDRNRQGWSCKER